MQSSSGQAWLPFIQEHRHSSKFCSILLSPKVQSVSPIQDTRLYFSLHRWAHMSQKYGTYAFLGWLRYLGRCLRGHPSYLSFQTLLLMTSIPSIDKALRLSILSRCLNSFPFAPILKTLLWMPPLLPLLFFSAGAWTSDYAHCYASAPGLSYLPSHDQNMNTSIHVLCGHDFPFLLIQRFFKWQGVTPFLIFPTTKGQNFRTEIRNAKYTIWSLLNVESFIFLSSTVS